MPESSCLGGHGMFPVQEHNQAISRDYLSEVVRLWWCALITHCSHSFSPNSLCFYYLFLLCLSSSLLCVCLPVICCHSVFVWSHITPARLCLSLPVTQSPPHDSARFGRVGSCELACLFACHCRVSWRSLSHMFLFAEHEPRLTLTSEGPGKETKRMRNFRGNGLIHCHWTLPWNNRIHLLSFLDNIEVNNNSVTMQCCSQRDIHNWRTSFATRGNMSLRGSERLLLISNGRGRKTSKNREMKRSSNYLNKSRKHWLFSLNSETLLWAHPLSNNEPIACVCVTGKGISAPKYLQDVKNRRTLIRYHFMHLVLKWFSYL